MTARGESGAALPELLVSLALSGVVLTASLPAVLAARVSAREAGAVAAAADGGRLAALRLGRDLRRAGFGLDGAPAGLSPDGAGVVVRYLDGGFTGGAPLTEPAAAGDRLLRVSAVGGFAAGDTVWLRDRHGGAGPYRVAGRDVAAGSLELDAPLSRPFLPADGARLYRLVERRWWRDGLLLRRDGQPALDGVAGLDTPVWDAAGCGAALEWLLAGRSAEASGRALAGARLVVAQGDPARRLTLSTLVRLDNAAGGSPLP